MTDSRRTTALFVADCHFHLEPDAAEARRVAHFLEFLAVAEGADHLVLLGDIFDFWFDYPHFRLKGYEEILQGLDRVRAAGTRLHFVGGNHDIWAASYLHRRFGTPPDAGPAILPLGGLRVRLDHGDGLLAYDWAYRGFRTLVRTRAGVIVAKCLHPEVLFAFSTWLSGRSRGANRDESARIEAKAKIWLASQPRGDWDLMIIGHLHHAFDMTANDHRMVGLAGWFDTLGYGVIREGEFWLADFAVEPDPLGTRAGHQVNSSENL